jgi:hypothetical protein
VATWRIAGDNFQREVGLLFTRSSATIVFVTDDLTVNASGDNEQFTTDQIENDVGLPVMDGVAANGTGYAPAGTILLAKRLVAGPSRGCAAVACVYGPPSRYRGGRYGGTVVNFKTDASFEIPRYQRLLVLGNGLGIYLKLGQDRTTRAVAVFYETRTFTPPTQVAVDDLIFKVARNFDKGYVRNNIPCILKDARISLAPGSPGFVEYRFEARAPVKAIPASDEFGFGLDVPALDWCEEYGEVLDETARNVVGIRVVGLPELYDPGEPLP